MDEETDFIGLISSFLGPPAPAVEGDSVEESFTETISSAPKTILPLSSSSTASHPDVFDIPSTRVVIFSKDRPWQLQQLLLSMKLTTDKDNSDDVSFLRDMEIFIIFKASSLNFVMGYEQVMKQFNSNKIRFLCEGEWMGDESLDVFPSLSGNMDNSFSYLLKYALDTNNADHEYPSVVMFLTDDCLFLESFEVVLAHAIGSLQYNTQDGRVFNFVTRLHPGISRSQTRDCITPSPKSWHYHSLVPYLSNAFAYEHASAKLHDGIYLYKTKSSSVEWNYPFDLSGGVYCYDDVQMILKQILTEDKGCTDKDGLAHPNIFEIRGNQALLALGNVIASRKTLSAVPSRPLMVVLAVNRVQNVCQAPIAYTGEGRVTNSVVPNCINGVDPANPVALLKLLQDEQHLDLAKYQSISYNSSHVGDLFLLQQPIPSLSSGHCHDISVLIPVHRGVDFASHSVASIIMQCIDEENISIQIVIVDDRCIDGSIDIMIQLCKTLLASQPKVALWVHDYRLENIILDQQKQQQQQIQSPITIAIDIVSSKSPGVASALNTGLDYCKSEFVARMDADDVSTPKRLLTQLRFMRNNSSINVVGASAVSFVAKESEHQTGLLPYYAVSDSKHQCRVLRTSLTVLDPGFMSWAMLFTCAIAHPTVMFRKSAIVEIGGYDTSNRSSEDYDLWLRLLEKDCHTMLCLPFVGVWHRKHNQSNSIKNSINQKSEANSASHRAIKQILSSTGISDDDSVLDIQHVSTLKDPDTATSLESINSAARLLLNIESSFIQNNAQCLTEHEISLIQNDCNSRIGELATIAITKFGKDNGFKVKGNLQPCYVWKMWEIRCPEDQFQRLSLLCYSNTSS